MVKTNRAPCRVRCPQRTSSASAEDGGRYMGRSGFTLVELLAVVGIMAIILFIALPSFESFKLRSSSSAIPTLMSTLRLARQYAITHRQEVFVVFPDGRGAYSPPGEVTKAYTAYAVIASNRATDRYEYITEWKTLPKGVFFHPSLGIGESSVFNSYGTGNITYFPFPNDSGANRNLCAVKFRPNGRAYLVNTSKNGWGGPLTSWIPITAGYLEVNTNSGTVGSPLILSDTNIVAIANLTGQTYLRLTNSL